MAVRLNITKKGRIIILACFMLVLAGAGGYLLWRVNQEDTVAPEDSEAGGGGGTGCSSSATATCVANCGSFNGFKQCYENGAYCGTVTCGTAKRCHCCDGNWVTINSGECTDACSGNGGVYGNCDDDTTVVKCSCASWGDGCGTNCTFPSGTQSSVNSAAKKDCSPKVAMCNVSTGKVSIEDYGPGHPCYNKLSQCNNPYAGNPCTEVKNSCDAGSWVTKPTGTYKHCDTIAYSATATDSDGIKESSIKAKLNNTDKTTFKKSTSGTTTTISDTLSDSTSCLAAGSYTLNLSWADTKGATSTACTLATTFTVQAEQTNPDWELTKNVVEACKDENTENPTSELTYTITLKNVGDGEGTITKIVDTPDTKALATYISSISNDGTYSSGNITWTLTDTTFAPQEQRTYTYKITVPKDAFGKYANAVTAYPAEGDNLVANAEITADCVIEAPDTGLFDSTWSKIVLGVILIGLGANYGRIVAAGTRFKLLVQKTRISMNDTRDEIRKKNFEKKVVKK